jgi:GDP-L-fucose synthase
MQHKVDFLQDNMAINDNVIRSSYKLKVRRLLCCLSSCIYPDQVPDYPILEEWLHLGPPHTSNEGYAYAKRMCEVQCRLYNEQYGTDFVCVVPTNLYGPGDNYAEDRSHVVAALIRRAHDASRKQECLEVFGSGSPLRQFCFAPDLALLLLWSVFV